MPLEWRTLPSSILLALASSEQNLDWLHPPHDSSARIPLQYNTHGYGLLFLLHVALSIFLFRLPPLPLLVDSQVAKPSYAPRINSFFLLTRSSSSGVWITCFTPCLADAARFAA